MLKLERFFVAFAAISLVIKLSGAAGGAIMLYFVLMFLSMFYFVFSFALLNGVGFRGIFRKVSYSGISFKRMIGAVFTGFVLSTLIIALLFKALHYSGYLEMYVTGLGVALIIVVIAAYQFYKTRTQFYSQVLLRVTIAIFVSTLLFVLD